MFRLTASSQNIEKAILAIPQMRSIFRGSQYSALRSVAWQAIAEIRDFIESGGSGTWPEPHPMTQRFKRTKDGRWRRRSDEDRQAYSEMGKFVRYLIEYRTAIFGFGTFSEKDAKKGRTLRFSQMLENLGKKMQKSEQIQANQAMQKLFGSARKNSRSKIGQDFFPIRQGTTLTREARPINVPMHRRLASIIPGQFERKFDEAFKKRLREFDF